MAFQFYQPWRRFDYRIIISSTCNRKIRNI